MTKPKDWNMLHLILTQTGLPQEDIIKGSTQSWKIY